MAIPSQRFKIFDKETNVAIKEFTDFSDNQIYTSIQDAYDSIVDQINNNNFLDFLEEKLDELIKTLTDNDIVKFVKDQMDNILKAIRGMSLPGSVVSILGSLTNIDLQGVKDFLQDTMKVGGRFLCNNLDFLKMFMLGYTINPNIISGLIMALLLSWLNRFCKGYSAEDVRAATPRARINMLFPPKGVTVTPENALNLFAGYYNDYIKRNEDSIPVEKYDRDTFISRVLQGDIKNSIHIAKESEIGQAEKDELLKILVAKLPEHKPGSSTYNSILEARAKINSTMFISDKREDNSVRYMYLNEKFSSYMKNLVNIDLKDESLLRLSAVEKSIYNKIKKLQNNASRDVALLSLPNDSLSNYDLKRLLPSLDNDEINYIKEKNNQTDSHRLYDLHPTTEVFIV